MRDGDKGKESKRKGKGKRRVEEGKWRNRGDREGVK
jgi:hypothetical protein